MTPPEIAAITKERLDRWGRLMSEQHATPLMVLGAGHDHRAGETQIFVSENATDNQIRQMLLGALAKLNQRN